MHGSLGVRLSSERFGSLGFQPSVEPLERFGLHFAIELVWARIKFRSVAVSETGFMINLAENSIRPLHLGQCEKLIS
jgi:hypothetical protein